MECSPPGYSAHGIFQARVLEWGAIAFSFKWLEESKDDCFISHENFCEIDVSVKLRCSPAPVRGPEELAEPGLGLPC